MIAGGTIEQMLNRISAGFLPRESKDASLSRPLKNSTR